MSNDLIRYGFHDLPKSKNGVKAAADLALTVECELIVFSPKVSRVIDHLFSGKPFPVYRNTLTLKQFVKRLRK
jgi:hypothetical protein